MGDLVIDGLAAKKLSPNPVAPLASIASHGLAGDRKGVIQITDRDRKPHFALSAVRRVKPHIGEVPQTQSGEILPCQSADTLVVNQNSTHPADEIRR